MANVPQPVNHLTRQFASREFCAFGLENNISCVPVDENENTRFDRYIELLQIDVLDLIIPELADVPQDDNETSVLDCGYGTGRWINDVLESQVDHDRTFLMTGIDIFDRSNSRGEDDSDGSGEGEGNALQEFNKIHWNINASFRLPPVREELTPETFHLINSRFLSDGVDRDRWPGLIREYFEMLEPGGWVQMVEVEWSFQSSVGQNLPRLEAWWNEYARALQQMRKNPRIARDLATCLNVAGFEEIDEQVVEVPVGGWQQDNGPFGTRNLERISEMLESFALVPFTRILRMSPQRCMDIVRDAQTELRSSDARIYNRLYSVVGRRPEAPAHGDKGIGRRRTAHDATGKSYASRKGRPPVPGWK